MRTSPNVHLDQMELRVVSMLLSQEILAYRDAPYDGVREHVAVCERVRRKIKREISKGEDRLDLTR